MTEQDQPPLEKESQFELPIYYVPGREPVEQYQFRAVRATYQPQELSREDKNVIRFASALLVAAAIAVGGTFTETLVDINNYDRFNPPRQTNDPFSWIAAPASNYYEQFRGNGPYNTYYPNNR